MALRSLAERLQARSPDSPQTSRELHANARARQTGHYFRYRLARRPAHAVAYGEMVFREPKTTKCRRRITLPGVVVDAVRAHRAEQARKTLAHWPNWVGSEFGLAAPHGSPWRSDIARPCGVSGRHRQRVVASYAHQRSLRPGLCADQRIRIGRRYGTTMM